jgi:hypothetical protein
MSSRPARLTWQRTVGIGAVWVMATAVVLLFAADTRVGPILVNLSERHGVHVGDVVALLAMYSGAAVLTWRIRRGAPGRGRRRAARGASELGKVTVGTSGRGR